MSFNTGSDDPSHAVPRTEPVSVLGRILALLEAVKRAEAPVSLAELSEDTGIPRSSTARLVAALVEQRYLVRAKDGVALGMRVFEFGSGSSVPKSMRATAGPLMKGLWNLTGDRVTLWMRQNEQMVLLAATTGRVTSLPTRAGMRTSVFNTASGKANMAFTDRQVVDRVCEQVRPDAASSFKSELSRVRSTSIAIDGGEAFPGVRGIATPVLLARGDAVGAIAVTGYDDLIDPVELAPHVRSAADALTRRLDSALRREQA